MSLPNRKGWFAVVFIVLALAIPFAITYYVSTPSYKGRNQTWQENSSARGLPVRSTVTADQAFLLKNEKIIIDRTGIVFKGFADKTVLLDLYLLDLDPEASYPLRFSQETIEAGVWLGDVSVSLVSVNASVLRLKIKNVYNTL